ncbi:hypothetical protein, partial [Serratia marcescens]|uniref:hypothetical protein n=1 Tax=Serratia marcescens TaxID=615 RepID=UPI001954E39B
PVPVVLPCCPEDRAERLILGVAETTATNIIFWPSNPVRRIGFYNSCLDGVGQYAAEKSDST